MEWKQLAPWNWFKNEEERGGAQVPVRVARPAGDPFGDLRAEIDRLSEAAFRRVGPGLPAEAGGIVLRPSLDISERRKAYTIRVEIPGVEKDDVTLGVDEDTLVIRGEKRREREESDESYHCVERVHGSFERVLSLPEDADPDRIEAKFRRGVLTITISKREVPASQRRRIEIEHE